ncbi:hypothetical protein ILUMI_07216 [Ignelater luminosus]|uniref:Uncharacterized protein n=1 Tax=Ignelater luminosus TaxID=2038154 RepID=A0A8K0D3V3_IGNLU|nr:hypothetical protein ILUMI_07216 [Ignelater luminosus]
MSAQTLTEEFISQFHSLTGTTIGERRKNLFILLNTIQTSSNYNDIDFSSIHPNNPLEETFKVEILIYFRKVSDLVEVLKSENPILIKKVLKTSPWFLEELFKNISGEQLVTLIFPYVSFNVKVKLLNKLSFYLKDSEMSEQIFNSIRLKYGSYLASKLLPACDKGFILKIVNDGRLKLTAKQVLTIIKKHPEMSSSIFETLNMYMQTDTIDSLYRKVFIYLAQNHQEAFLDLYNTYNPSMRLGWRATHKLICKNKEIVIKNAKDIYRYLHKKQLFKSLSMNFSDFYIKLFPSSVEQFPNNFKFLYSFLLTLKSEEERLKFLEESFKRNYGSNLLENINCINNADLLDILPVNKLEEIEQKPALISEDKWSCYSKIEKSIPYLKKRISLSSDIKSREYLVEHLVFTCKVNKDKRALLDVFKYIVNQHRNDHWSVRHSFLTAVKNLFKPEELDEEHWIYLNELLEIIDINNEVYYYYNGFLSSFILYKLLNGLPINENLLKYTKSCNGNYNVFRFNPVFEKQCLLLIEQLLPEIFIDKYTLKLVSDILLKYYNIHFWKQSKNYFHLEIPQKMTDFYIQKFYVDFFPNNLHNYDILRQKNLITALSHLTGDKFLDFASNYHPKELRGDCSQDNNQRLYRLQFQIGKALKNVIPPSMALESILQYCKGDYLKLIQSSLYSVSGNINENKLPSFFDALGRRAVSVRKHAFHLTLRVLDRSLIFDVFKKFMETEKNASIRKFLFKGSFNLFLQDPDDNIWEMIRSNLERVDVNDREVVSILTDIESVPPAYVARYILYIWEFLERLPDHDDIIESEKCRILCFLSPQTIQNLPKDFCLKIIKDYFLKHNQHNLNINSFTLRFIMYYSNSEMEFQDRMNIIFPIIKNYIPDKKYKSMIDLFVTTFCSEFLNKKCLTKSVLLMFMTTWNTYITPEQAFDQYLYINLSLIFVDVENLNLSPLEIGQKLADLANSLSEAYTVAVVTVFCDVLRSFVRHFSSNDETRYHVIEGIISTSRSTACLMVAISLLKRNLDNFKIQMKHDEIVQCLNEINEPIVQIYLNHHLH